MGVKSWNSWILSFTAQPANRKRQQPLPAARLQDIYTFRRVRRLPTLSTCGNKRVKAGKVWIFFFFICAPACMCVCVCSLRKERVEKPLHSPRLYFFILFFKTFFPSVSSGICVHQQRQAGLQTRVSASQLPGKNSLWYRRTRYVYVSLCVRAHPHPAFWGLRRNAYVPVSVWTKLYLPPTPLLLLPALNPFEEEENVDARFVEETALKQTSVQLGFEAKWQEGKEGGRGMTDGWMVEGKDKGWTQDCDGARALEKPTAGWWDFWGVEGQMRVPRKMDKRERNCGDGRKKVKKKAITETG